MLPPRQKHCRAPLAHGSLSAAAVTIATRVYSGNSARSASVPDPPGGMKFAANAKARIGAFEPSGAMRWTVFDGHADPIAGFDLTLLAPWR